MAQQGTTRCSASQPPLSALEREHPLYLNYRRYCRDLWLGGVRPESFTLWLDRIEAGQHGQEVQP